MSNLFKRQDPTKLQEQLKGLNGGGGFQKDEKEWRPNIGADGTFSARIRFLPARSDKELAFVKLVTHGAKQNGQWYINNCPSTYGDYDGCPVCKYISDNDLYEKSKVKGSKAEALYNGAGKAVQGIKRGTNYWANILILKDPSTPENEGKVFKFRFGKKIYDMINAQINVDVSLGETPVDVTCPFGGADFTLKIKKVFGMNNYDDSKFANPSELAGINDPAFQQFLMDNMNDLRPIVAKDQFKSFDELNKQFLKMMGGSAVAAGAVGGSAGADLDKELDDFDKELGDFDKGTPAQSSGGVQNLNTSTSDSLPDDDDDVPFDTGSSDGDMDELDKLLAE